MVKFLENISATEAFARNIQYRTPQNVGIESEIKKT